MKLLTLITFLVLTTNTFAIGIEIESAQIACLRNTDNIYTYGIELVVKNTSKKSSSIISKTNHALIAHHKDGESAEITISHSPQLANEIPIIPVQEELGIVNLFSGEGAKITDQVSNRKLFKYATIKYNRSGPRFSDSPISVFCPLSKVANQAALGIVSNPKYM